MQGKVSPEPNAQTRVYVGIDTCKEWLDAYVHPIGRSFRVANSREGLKQLKRKLAGLAVVLVVMESTGKLHREAYRSGRRRGCPHRPPTPPDVRFRIRRFMMRD